MPKTETDAKKAAKAHAKKDGTVGTTHLALLCDESGSMAGNREAVISGVNEFIEQFRNQPYDVKLWLASFDKHPGEPRLRVHIDGQKPKKSLMITTEHYEPRGLTPLNDAIAETIEIMARRVKKGDKALVVILTDGAENASTDYGNNGVATGPGTDRLKKLIRKYDKREEWTFLYLGANQNAERVAANIGLGGQGQSVNFDATPSGTRSTFRYAGQTAGLRANTSSKADYAAQASALYEATGGKIKEEDDDESA